MSMSISVHVNSSKKVEIRSRVSHVHAEPHGTLHVGTDGGDVTLFVNLENIKQLKKELGKLEKDLKKEFKELGLGV